MKKDGKAPTLDLHGYKMEDVFDAVERFITRHTNARVVRIMPGKGTGKVKSEVTRYLKLAGYHWHFERSERGQVNEGVMIVHME